MAQTSKSLLLIPNGITTTIFQLYFSWIKGNRRVGDGFGGFMLKVRCLQLCARTRQYPDFCTGKSPSDRGVVLSVLHYMNLLWVNW